jgi:hypothetical protein
MRSILIPAISILLVPASGAPRDSGLFLALLRQNIGGSEADLARDLQGGVAARIIPHTRDGGLAVGGAVRIPVTIKFYIDSFRDISAFKKNPSLLNIGKFGDPPAEENLARLSLSQKDRDSIGKCKAGNCGLKLSAEMIRLLRGDGKLNSATLDTRFRSALWSYISAYLRTGTPAMAEYYDKSQRVAASTEFRGILSQFGWLNDYAPPLLTALNAPYQPANNKVEQFLYWSVEDFGLKPVISVTQVLIYRTTLESRNWAFIASKQIYADHYVNASLGLTVLAEEEGNPSHPMLSVAYFNRSVTDGLRGWFSSLQRSIVEGRLEAATRKNLSALRMRLANSYRTRQHAEWK